MFAIFDTPWLLLTIAAVLLIVAGLVRQIKPQWGLLPFLLPLIIALAALGLDKLVQTDTEKIYDIIRHCRRFAVEKNMDGIASLVSENYRDTGHTSKETFIQAGRQILNSTALTHIAERTHIITLNGNQAESELDLRIHLDPQQSAYPGAGSLLFVSFRITYVKNSTDQWKISRVDLTSVNNQSMGWSDVR